MPGARAAVYVPAPHMPPERRLLLDSSALRFGESLGIRHTVLWTDCQAVLLWPDRAELVLNEEVSVLVRAADWWRGSDMLAVLERCAPQTLQIPMPEDPEDDPWPYALTGLARISDGFLILWVLAAAGMGGLCAAVGFSEPRSWQAVVVGFVMGALALPPGLALRRQWQVPREWRERAARRGGGASERQRAWLRRLSAS